jgi:hypothetical protein
VQSLPKRRTREDTDEIQRERGRTVTGMIGGKVAVGWVVGAAAATTIMVLDFHGSPPWPAGLEREGRVVVTG